jgi:hypothetical protein
MKVVAGVVALAALAGALVTYFEVRAPAATAVSPPAAVRAVTPDDHSDSARLSQQMDDLRRRLAAIQEQLTAQQRQLGAPKSTPTAVPGPPDLQAVEAQRAADLERHQTYMAGVGQAFANERVDPAWASRTSALLAAAFEGDPMLRGVAHTVECRQQTCRVQIEDDGSVNARLPRLAIGVADVLPTLSAERIDQGNGRNAMVLYMSSQRPAPPGGLPKH